MARVPNGSRTTWVLVAHDAVLVVVFDAAVCCVLFRGTARGRTKINNALTPKYVSPL